MVLEELRLKNFRGYKEETRISISELTALIGKNDAGKSSVLEALEIFFNNSLVTCEREDLNIEAEDNNIEISCIFGQVPDEIIIDASSPTSLREEFLLNSNDKLEIKKVFTTSSAKPKEKVFIKCNHPTIAHANDLLELKRQELKTRADSLKISVDQYNRNVNSTMRQAIWNSFQDLNLEEIELSVDKEDSKKVYEALKSYLPIYALFQSDRQSRDDDKEVSDPMKIAVQQALSELQPEIEHIKNHVRNRATETASRTLEKLKEMSPELASELTPEFRSDPKFESQFKLTIKSEDNIPVNKRGSGVRRLILLNFFRAEAERLRNDHQGNNIIFAFEEPETSQHPDHQEILVKSFIDLANTGNSQIILTTHTPALASLLPLDSLRYIEKFESGRKVEMGTNEVFEKIANTLGVLPDPVAKNATALFLIEGKSDVTFINHIASKLKIAGHLSHTFEDKRIALVPIGGCGNLKHWQTLRIADQFKIPYCVLLDSDKGTTEEQANFSKIEEFRQNGIKAYVTRKREPENYIHMDCLDLPPSSTLNLTDTCDAKQLIANAKAIKKESILEKIWIKMTAEQIREVERYEENGIIHYEFTEMFQDFFSLV